MCFEAFVCCKAFKTRTRFSYVDSKAVQYLDQSLDRAELQLKFISRPTNLEISVNL